MLADLLRQCLTDLRAHLGRTALALLGIVWGTASVIMLVAYGTGLRDSLVEQASSGGRQMLAFFPGRSTSGVGANRGGREIKLKPEDARLLAEQIPALEHVSGGIIWWGGVYVRRGANYRRVATLGLEPDAAAIMELSPAEGRWFSDRDLAHRERVVVLGAELKQQLFGSHNAVGERLEVNGVGYTVIGVLAKKGDQISSLGPPDDYKLLVPLTTFQALMSGNDEINFIAVKPRRATEHVAVETQVRKVLGTRHAFAADDRDALSVFDVMNFVDLFRNLTNAVRLFSSIVGVVTLTIGGVAVMNIMLLAVSERSREIGLRQAVGASRVDILRQFLAEGLVMTAGGGAIGMGLGWALCHGMAVTTASGTYAAAYLSSAIIFTTIGLIGLVGLLATIWPAMRAANLDPAEALRQ